MDRRREGATADEVHPTAVAEAERAFAQSADGPAGFCPGRV
ncbi:hypothetical protein [Embleya sp. NPDC001921]